MWGGIVRKMAGVLQMSAAASIAGRHPLYDEGLMR
jgi:hypothetical protein